MEKVLAVPSSKIFKNGTWQGIRTEKVDEIFRIIKENSKFFKRESIEDDPSLQQIIPYFTFKQAEKVLLFKRLKGSSEGRLHHLYSIGLGGHIKPEDADSPNPIEASALREFREEVEYKGSITLVPIGIIKDSFTPVSQVHLGIFYLVIGDSKYIKIREQDKISGTLLSLKKIKPFYPRFEAWSRIVFDYLEKREC